MATKSRSPRRSRTGGARPAEPRPSRRNRRRPRPGVFVWVVVGLVAAVGAFLFAREQAVGGDAVEPPPRGLPATPDYHSLLIDPSDPKRLLLGTHVGVYESRNGGVSWRFAGLEGKDAMHFARGSDGTLWAAGHEVLERSDDMGRTWEEFRPEGLPGLDIHGFAVDQTEPLVYAAVAGEGLFRSDDGGRSFRLISKEVGPSVTALALTKDGVLFAADGERGVFVNANGDGVEWVRALDMPTIGLAANWLDPPGSRVLAAGRSIQLTTERGAWQEVLEVGDWVGPVAYAPSDPSVAYAVGYDRKLYRSSDGGATWQPVA